MTSLDDFSAQSHFTVDSSSAFTAPDPSSGTTLPAPGAHSLPFLSSHEAGVPFPDHVRQDSGGSSASAQVDVQGWDEPSAIDPVLRSPPVKPWPLRIDLASEPPSQIYSSPSSTSPPTPSSAGLDFGLSRQSSTTDFSGLMPGSEDSEPNSGDPKGDDAGVPPPRPKKSHARKQPEGHIKRARNKFILFRKHITDAGLIPPSVESKHQNISVVAAKMWREAPEDVRQKFEEQARIEKEEHQRKYPGYRYQPVVRRTDIIRRRVRKDPSEDKKVEAVAEALIQGKHGQELEHEIRSTIKDSVKSDAESDTESRSSRRRRRDVGQMSKGAIRAQRAQNRAKAMRQNLLGSSLASMQIYNQNAAYQAAAAAAAGVLPAYRTMPHHPGAAHLYASNEYASMTYDADGRLAQPYYEGYDTSYRLPPIQGIEHGVWDPAQMGGYYAAEGSQAAYAVPQQDDYLPDGAQYEQYLDPDAYRAPLETAQEVPAVEPLPVTRPADIVASSYQESWAAGHDGLAAQQTPSGHVVFNERLFDGELGSATFERDDGLGDFGDAVAEAGGAEAW
ncbi:hypothetical protein Q5752_006324 [Cryptotrichosporon argae]